MKELRIKNKESRIKEKGQIIIILLLLMLVTLSIGLALTQKSVTDVTTSTQTEQSSRAFSAAEAGIQKALTGTIPSGTSFDLDNDSTAIVNTSDLLPLAGSKKAIEYPPIGRETTAQFWLTNPKDEGETYGHHQVDLYFGNEGTITDKPAVEVKIIMLSNDIFYSKAYYYDSDATRSGPTGNNFSLVSGCGSETLSEGILGNDHRFYCSQRIGPIPDLGGPGNCPNANCKLILARVRFLYTNENHNLALAPISNKDFPPQVQINNATGKAGQSAKQIQAFKVIDVVPPWFDFAVFSVDKISK